MFYASEGIALKQNEKSSKEYPAYDETSAGTSAGKRDACMHAVPLARLAFGVNWCPSIQLKKDSQKVKVLTRRKIFWPYVKKDMHRAMNQHEGFVSMCAP